MIIKTFKSGHPIGSSLDPSGPSGLTQQHRASYNSQYWNPSAESNGNLVGSIWDEENKWNTSAGVVYNNYQYHYNKPETSSVCQMISSSYTLELIIVWVSLPLILGLIHLWRSSKRRSSEANEKPIVCTTS